ncbi:MAG: ABC transporter permease subunit [Lachnospiraceae bacterium]|nr:ABC transporter permease subunit [Lachnospiraceae bacterium]
MKKTNLLLLCTLLLFLLAGCGREEAAIQSLDDLAGKRIGVQITTTGDIYVKDEYEGDEAGTVIERYNKGNDAISSLKNGKIDCVVIDEEPAKQFVKRNQDLSILEEEFVTEEYAICIAKENTQLKEEINQALAELKEDGTLQNIIEGYINEEGDDAYRYESPKGQTYENGKLIMSTNAAFPPYEFYENNQITGLDVDMATALADKLHRKLEVIDTKFESIISDVQTGKADIGAAGMTVTEDRLKNIDFTESYTTSKQVIIVRNGGSGATLSLKDSFYQNFIEDNRYQYILKGLGNTLLIALLAVLLGVIIGFVVSIIRTTHDKTGSLKVLNLICRVYLTIIRGTPTMVQLLIIYYIIFSSVDVSKVLVAVLAFGINSGAYVAEILRGGIMSLSVGQFEGARSLGLTHVQTMRYIVLPQVLKNTLPALANEFIVLIKETSISGYIGLQDLTMAGDIIRGTTYQAFFPLIAVACIYLVIVMLLSMGVHRLERSLKKNER